MEKSLTSSLPPPLGRETAIVGLGSVLPSGAASMRDLRRLLDCGVDGVGEVPSERWGAAVATASSGPIASRVRHGGFVGGAELFDNVAFLISRAEVAAMDPQQRILLERGFASLRVAGLDRTSLGGSLTGVFLGIATCDFQDVLASTAVGASVYSLTGITLSIASGRLSYALGLHGPCISYDTACSAALVACHAGLRALQLEECTASLAAGANLMLAPRVGV